MRRWVQATREEILRHARGATHVRLDDDVRNDVVLLRTGLLRKHALIEPVIHAREFAGLFCGDEVDALHSRGQVLGVAKVPVQTKEISGKPQDEFLHFLARVSLDSPGDLLNGSQRQLLRRNLLDDSFHLLQLILGDQRPAKLLKMQRRAIFRSNWTNFIAGQDMEEHFVLFEAIEKPRQELGAKRRGLLRPGFWIEQALCVSRVVEIFAEPGCFAFAEEIDRKSTRLNSSHRTISYAVFCLKKKRQRLICV